MTSAIKSKLVFKDLGEPSLIKALPETETKMLLGSIIGKADGTIIKKGPDGVTNFKGLKGTFEGIPADAKKDSTKSGITFLGDAFQGDIVAMLEETDAEGNLVGPESVSFAFEVWVIRAKNPQGYSWALVPLTKPAEVDPLSEMRALLANKRGEQEKLDAPAKHK